MKQTDYFDAIYAGDSGSFFQLVDTYRGKTEARKNKTHGLSGLFCAIIYSRLEMAIELLPELNLRCTRQFRIARHEQEILVPMNSSALHLAILLDRQDLVMHILKFLSREENTTMWNDAGRPNSLGFTNLYYFASCLNTTMALIPVSVYYIFTLEELTSEPLNGILRCVAMNQNVLLGHVLNLCERISYFRTVLDFLSQFAPQIYGILNQMLCDASINQTHLAWTRSVIVSFFDGILPTREFVMQGLRADIESEDVITQLRFWKRVDTEMRVQTSELPQKEDSSLSGEQLIQVVKNSAEIVEDKEASIPYILTMPLSLLSSSTSEAKFPEMSCSQ